MRTCEARFAARAGGRALTCFCAVALLVGLLAGCGKDAAPGQVSDSSAGNPASSSDREHKAVLAAYDEYWTAFAAASDPPHPNAKGLARHAAEPELSKAKRAIDGWAKESAAFQARYSHAHSTAAVTGSTAVVDDCMSLDGKVVDRATKKITSKTDPAPVAVRADLELVAGDWKVSRVRTGPQACSPTAGSGEGE